MKKTRKDYEETIKNASLKAQTTKTPVVIPLYPIDRPIITYKLEYGRGK